MVFCRLDFVPREVGRMPQCFASSLLTGGELALMRGLLRCAQRTPCIIRRSSGEASSAITAQPRPIHISSQNRCS